MTRRLLPCGCGMQVDTPTGQVSDRVPRCGKGWYVVHTTQAAAEAGDREAFAAARQEVLTHFDPALLPPHPRRYMYAAERPLLPNPPVKGKLR